MPFVRAQGVELEERRCDRVFPERAQTRGQRNFHARPARGGRRDLDRGGAEAGGASVEASVARGLTAIGKMFYPAARLRHFQTGAGGGSSLSDLCRKDGSVSPSVVERVRLQSDVCVRPLTSTVASADPGIVNRSRPKHPLCFADRRTLASRRKDPTHPQPEGCWLFSRPGRDLRRVF